MSARAVRSLEHLENTASTARVLNLRALALRHADNPDYQSKPIFKNTALNRAIILKHRLRPNEFEDFSSYRHSATKILLPLETADLKLGAHYIFVGQKNFEQVLSRKFGISPDAASEDLRTLAILDETPSLDPFLLREQLKRRGVDAASCYFDISEADMHRMFDFAQQEITQLVYMSIGDHPSFRASAARLARKILMNAGDAELEPLRATMQLSPQQYQEGVFCWKAFLYYKWRLTHVLPQLNEVVAQIAKIFPRGQAEPELKAYLAEAREAIRDTVVKSCRRVRETIGVYDDAYEAMTKRGDPLRFRDFLLQAPAMFDDLGERLGAIDHIISFWRFRFPADRRPVVTADELADIFADFEQSLMSSPRKDAA